MERLENIPVGGKETAGRSYATCIGVHSHKDTSA